MNTLEPDEAQVAQAREWLVAQLASELQIPAETIRTDRPITGLGVDSMQVVAIIARTEDRFGFRFESNPLDDHPTIEQLSRFVVTRIQELRPGAV